jgi:hypothetical protein
VRVAGLDEAHAERIAIDPGFRKNWQLVQSWSEQSRYRRNRPEDARELLGAIGDKKNGVISWIKLQW